MELLVMRDLIRDDIGNYYIIEKREGNKIFIINAFIHHSFRRILSEDFVKEVYSRYDKPVAVGQYFRDALINRVEGIESGKYPGGIYNLNDIAKEYEIHFNLFYERDITNK